MVTNGDKRIFTDWIKINPFLLVSILILVNFLLRIFIWSHTTLFRFIDYGVYLDGVFQLVRGKNLFLLSGNYLFGVSYLGFYFERIMGSLDYFFVFNCLFASLTSLILFFLVIRVTGNELAGFITVTIQTLYTEYMVFSSVFYSPVLMIFLLSIFLVLTYYYFTSMRQLVVISSAAGLLLIFLLTFFFKPELQYLPWFLIVLSLFFIRKNRTFFIKTFTLSFLLFTFYFLLNFSGIITHPKNNVISNDFIFFGHTDYGGDGGEGSFIYPENKLRYETALAEYCKREKITIPTIIDLNRFRHQEMINFITHHPSKWIGLQLKKFFRTFGVVPETSSFKILYTGLFKGNLWLTSIVVVVPVAVIIVLFILFFNYSAILELTGGAIANALPETQNPRRETIRSQNSKLKVPLSSLSGRIPNTDNNKYFLIIYGLLFFYYIIATIFYGQYQERYRMPVMVVFLIPILGYFIASFYKQHFLRRSSLIIKGAIIVVFMTIWIFQANIAIGNKQRFENAIKKTELQIQ